MASDNAIVVFDANTQLSTHDDLWKLTNNPEMDKMVKNSYGNIDLRETFENLVDCGKMLQIALTAAGDQPCSVDILTILSKYQNLVHESTVTSRRFVSASIQALLRHRDAIEIFTLTEPNDFVDVLPDVLDELSKCYHTAMDMEKQATDAANHVQKVSEIAETALFSAKRDLGDNAQKNKEVQDQIEKLQAEQEASEALLKKYAAAVKELGDEKRQAAKEAANARDRAFALEMTAAVMSSVGDLANIYASATQPMYIAGKVAGTIPGDNNNGGAEKSSSPSSSDANNTVMSPELMELEKEMKAKEDILQKAKEDPGANTAEGKDSIKNAQADFDASKEIFERTQSALSQASNGQQRNAASLEEKAAVLSQKYYEMVESEASAAALQAKNLHTLKTMRTEKTFIEQSIFLLQFSYKILGRVKTTFLNVKTFWELLAADCQKIADMKETVVNYGEKAGEAAKSNSEKKYELYKKMFNKMIVRSTQSWASVGRISLDAYSAITDAKSTVDGVMEKLPTGVATEDELDSLIKTIEPRIQQKLLVAKKAQKAIDG